MWRRARLYECIGTPREMVRLRELICSTHTLLASELLDEFIPNTSLPRNFEELSFYWARVHPAARTMAALVSTPC